MTQDTRRMGESTKKTTWHVSRKGYRRGNPELDVSS
ncbi:predicted protein [Sclerotinia sclerotiorum 1980 UF-70]|uniref:Uncharacterized protein n=1 Tax=Sclerotinia sclerotiorum (strain ATCC 18683 / 1980 / Ss-1) TaxID=665079 RepID=A7EFS5_SCLS1|nr:predicted protein [Sclerotinia sclerotiorum 1980 UF-70]EDO01691.1 predicted protein [Sclerotinia sclerotiorum 1980 UF-70]